MENKSNHVMNETIAELYTIERAFNICGIEKMYSDVWNKEFDKHYEEKLKDLNKSKSTRQLAIEQWNSLPQQEQETLFKRYVNSGKFTMALTKKELTGSEIEYILLNYKSEQKQSHSGISKLGTGPGVKFNKKQFVEFNPELFKAYLDKFSEEDKFKIFTILARHFENHIYGFYKDGDFDRSQNNACLGSFKSRFEAFFNK